MALSPSIADAASNIGQMKELRQRLFFVVGALIGSGSRNNVFLGYLFGATLMVAGGLIQARFGLAAERRSLEHIAPPLSAADK